MEMFSSFVQQKVDVEGATVEALVVETVVMAAVVTEAVVVEAAAACCFCFQPENFWI